MANITTPYSQGTITAIADEGATLVVDTDVTLDWINRIIFMTDGDGIRNYRRIDNVNALDNHLNLDVPFGESPFRSIDSLRTGTKFTEGDVAVGDTFSISYDWGDLSDNADITISNSGQFVDITGGTTLSTGVVIYDENKTIQWEYSQNDNSNIRINFGAAIILGRQHFGDTSDEDVLGYTSNSCRVIDTSIGTSSSDGPGTFHMNGGTYEVSGSRTFLRFNSSTSSIDQAQNFRMWNVKIYGAFGARISGDQTVMLNTESVGNTGTNGTLGIANPIRPGIFLNCASRDARQGIYHFPATAGNVTVEAFDIQDIATTVIRIDTNGSQSNNTLTLNNWSFPDLTAATADGTNVDTFQRTVNRAAHQVRFTKDVEFTVVNVDGTNPNDGLTDPGRVIFRDAFDALTIDSDGGNGSFPSINLLGRDAVTSTNLTFGSFDDTDVFDVYTPYDYAIKYRNHNLLLGNTSFDTGSGAFTQTLTRTIDPNITDTDFDSVDGYTTLGTSARIYDFADKFKTENIQQPVPLEQFFEKSGDVLTFTQPNVNVELLSTITPVFAYLGDLIENDRDLTPTFGPNANITSVDRDEIACTTASSLVNSNLTNLQSGDWDNWVDNYLWINLDEDGDAAESFLENARSHGNVIINETIADGSATFTLDDDASIFTNGNAKGILLGAITAQNGAGPQLASQICQVAYQEDTRLCIKTPAAGYTGGMIVDGGDITVDTEIQGQITCNEIQHSFTDGDRIINTSEAIDATIALAPGEYFIDDADISNLTINRDSDSGTVTITNNANVTGTPTLGTGVQLNLVLEVTVNGPSAGDGRLSIFESDGTLIADTESNTFSISIVDYPTLSNESNPIWVWSGPGYVDVRGTAQVLFGTNVYEEDPLVKRYQDFSEDEPTPTVTAAIVDTDTDYVLFDISGATGDGVFTDGSFNYFANTQMVGLAAYNRRIALDENAIHAVSSLGATGTAVLNSTYARVRPGEDASQLLGFIFNDGTNEDDPLAVDRESGGFTFSCLIPASSVAVDTAQLESIYRNISNDQTESIKGSNNNVDLTSLRKSIFAASQL